MVITSPGLIRRSIAGLSGWLTGGLAGV